MLENIYISLNVDYSFFVYNLMIKHKMNVTNRK